MLNSRRAVAEERPTEEAARAWLGFANMAEDFARTQIAERRFDPVIENWRNPSLLDHRFGWAVRLLAAKGGPTAGLRSGTVSSLALAAPANLMACRSVNTQRPVSRNRLRDNRRPSAALEPFSRRARALDRHTDAPQRVPDPKIVVGLCSHRRDCDYVWRSIARTGRALKTAFTTEQSLGCRVSARIRFIALATIPKSASNRG